MNNPLRVALFTDAFHEANGVGTLSREFAHFAQGRDLPFCCVHAGKRTRTVQDGSLLTIELKRSLASFPVDKDLYCDVLLNRHRNWVIQQLTAFKPDLIHITGPGDLGVLGFWIAHCMKLPLVASWHTNLHEYAGRRLDKALAFLPGSWRKKAVSETEHQSLRALLGFYRLAYFVMAPNQDMVDLLEAKIGRPGFLMSHGVDVDNFSPCRRPPANGHFCIGYVGRLTPEKNVQAFHDLEQKLLAAGHNNFRMLIVGDGSQRDWLKKNVRSAELPGVLRGEQLAAAFAGMDAFVFPSRTDTFGLVILEAMASGVPVVVSPETGAHVGVRHGGAGFLADDPAEGVLELMRCRGLRERMGGEARRFASARVWSGVFEDVYRTYQAGLDVEEVRQRLARKRAGPAK